MPNDGAIVESCRDQNQRRTGKQWLHVAADDAAQPNVVLVNQNAINKFNVGAQNCALCVMRIKHSKARISQKIVKRRTGCKVVADE